MTQGLIASSFLEKSDLDYNTASHLSLRSAALAAAASQRLEALAAL